MDRLVDLAVLEAAIVSEAQLFYQAAVALQGVLGSERDRKAVEYGLRHHFHIHDLAGGDIYICGDELVAGCVHQLLNAGVFEGAYGV